MNTAALRVLSPWRTSLEEIVGNIEDEYDPPDEEVVLNADGSYTMSGLVTPAEAGEYIPS